MKRLYRDIREILDLTADDVAKEMHTTKQTICNIETGKSSTPMSVHFYIQTLHKLAMKDPERIEQAQRVVQDILTYLNGLS